MVFKHAHLSCDEIPSRSKVKQNRGIIGHSKHTLGILCKNYRHDIMLSYVFKNIQLNAHDMEIKSVKVVLIVIGFSQVRERTRGQFLLRSRVLATLQR
jgi:hypothetical protein